MSVYVGIDVYRKRYQVAVVTGDGTVELNKNVVLAENPIRPGGSGYLVWAEAG
jgi:hypothetical protein